jgi:hypothetical protein
MWVGYQLTAGSIAIGSAQWCGMCSVQCHGPLLFHQLLLLLLLLLLRAR